LLPECRLIVVFFSLPQLLQECKVSSSGFKSEMTALVATFKLSAQNVVLKPREWKIVSLILLIA
jgi:hypothetical protein